MYGKLFVSMYDGSIYGEWEALVTFQQLIILADRDGTIEMTPQALAARTSIPLEILSKGIKLLESPDPNSRTPDEEGRRIIRIDPLRPWGWHITNYAKYREIRTAEERREYHRKYWHKRKKQSQPDSTGTQQTQPIVEVKVAVKADNIYTQTFEETWKQYPKRAGSNPKRAAYKAWGARPDTDTTKQEGMARYANFCRETGKIGTEYVMQARTFFGPDQHYHEDWSVPKTEKKPWEMSDKEVLAECKELNIKTKGKNKKQLHAEMMEKRGQSRI